MDATPPALSLTKGRGVKLRETARRYLYPTHISLAEKQVK